MINADHKGRYRTRPSRDGSASGAAIRTASGARLVAITLNVHLKDMISNQNCNVTSDSA